MTGAGGSVTAPRRESLRIRVLPIVHERAVGPIPSRSTRGGLQVQAPIPARCMTRFSALLIAAFFLPGAQVAHAQAELSLTGGVSLSAENGDAPVGGEFDSVVTRMFVGLAATIPVSDRRFGLQFGGRYAQKGGGSRHGVDRHIHTEYVEFMALARATLSDDRDGVSVHLLAGPALGLLVGCRFDVEHFDRGDALNCDQAWVHYRRLDVGLAGGAEIDIGLTDSVKARLGALYTHGLSDISKADERGDDTVRNRSLTIHAGLAVPLPRGR